MAENKFLDARSLETLREFLNRTSSDEWLCSSFYEFAPWYRYNYGFLVLCRLTGVKIVFRDVLRALKSSLSNLWFQSKIQFAPSTRVSSSSDIIFTWLLNENETRQECLHRYFGPLANDPASVQSHIWAIATCPISNESKLRLNSEGVSLIWKTCPSLSDMSGAVLKVFSGLSPMLLFDAEYWTGRQITGKFLAWLRTSNITHPKVLLAYEQQPWQLALMAGIKSEYWDKSTIVGDAHTSLTNFPSQFIKTRISPDQIVVHGNAFKRVLVHHLGWTDASVAVIPSRRFRQKLNYSSSQIILPYVMTSDAAIISAIRKITATNPHVARWEVRPHPARLSDSRYSEIVAAIQSCVDQLNLTLQHGGRIMILVYGVSTLILEALESGYDVYNVVEHPKTDRLSPEIWDGITAEHLNENLTKYRLMQSGEFVIYS